MVKYFIHRANPVQRSGQLLNTEKENHPSFKNSKNSNACTERRLYITLAKFHSRKTSGEKWWRAMALAEYQVAKGTASSVGTHISRIQAEHNTNSGRNIHVLHLKYNSGFICILREETSRAIHSLMASPFRSNKGVNKLEALRSAISAGFVLLYNTRDLLYPSDCREALSRYIFWFREGSLIRT